MINNKLQPKRALISVSDKTGLLALAGALKNNKVDIVSTGGTLTYLRENGFSVTHVSDITQFPEIMSGRIKTLHPLILGGILGRRGIDDAEANQHHVSWIDIVVCNLYPFEEIIQDEHCQMSDALEHIDIGGPTMLRAAAKNFTYLTVVSSPSDYSEIIQQLHTGGIDYATRKKMAYKTFSLTAHYDGAIANFFNDDTFPETMNLHYKKISTLRYGENPHQQAAVYREAEGTKGLLTTKQYQGKALSYNNLVDAQAAITCLNPLDTPACSVIKHAMPCGIAMGTTIHEAFDKAFNADSKSGFGGVIALNRFCNGALAKSINQYFVEIVIGPEFSDEALELFSLKPNIRLLHSPSVLSKPKQIKKYLPGGLLLQAEDNKTLTIADLHPVTEQSANDRQIEQLLFAWHCVKYVKSNAIVIANNHVSLGMAGGHVSRIDAVELAIRKAGKKANGAVLASDAFFPFRDNIDMIASAGIAAIIQPGGSKRDAEVIEACNDHGIAMVFTNVRCFYH